MRYDHIAWDFNGTILDDAAVSMAITTRLMSIFAILGFR